MGEIGTPERTDEPLHVPGPLREPARPEPSPTPAPLEPKVPV